MVYKWSDSAGDSSVFSTSQMANISQVYCILISDAPCVTQSTALSNFISVTVNPVKTPVIELEANKISSCRGENVIINTNIENGGSAPVYRWYINGEKQTENSGILSSATLNDGSKIYCEMISDAECLSDTISISDTITLEINPVLTPHISIISSATNVCSDDTITLQHYLKMVEIIRHFSGL